MEATKSRIKTNMYGQAILSSDNLRELLLQGKNIGHLNVVFDEEIELFQKHQHELLKETVEFLGAPSEELTFDDFHAKCADEWVFPKTYQHVDVKGWLLD